jgi:hypothetical protein
VIWYEHRSHGTALPMTTGFGPCAVCGGPTNSIDVSFESFLHQGVCLMLLDREFWLAVAS